MEQCSPVPELPLLSNRSIKIGFIYSKKYQRKVVVELQSLLSYSNFLFEITADYINGSIIGLWFKWWSLKFLLHLAYT